MLVPFRATLLYRLCHVLQGGIRPSPWCSTCSGTSPTSGTPRYCIGHGGAGMSCGAGYVRAQPAMQAEEAWRRCGANWAADIATSLHVATASPTHKAHMPGTPPCCSCLGGTRRRMRRATCRSAGARRTPARTAPLQTWTTCGWRCGGRGGALGADSWGWRVP